MASSSKLRVVGGRDDFDPEADTSPGGEALTDAQRREKIIAGDEGSDVVRRSSLPNMPGSSQAENDDNDSDKPPNKSQRSFFNPNDTWTQRVAFAERLRGSARQPAPQTPESRRSTFETSDTAATHGRPISNNPSHSDSDNRSVLPAYMRAAGLRSRSVTEPHRKTLPPPAIGRSSRSPEAFTSEEPSSAHDHATNASAIMKEAQAQIRRDSGPLSAVRDEFNEEPISATTFESRVAAVQDISSVRAKLATDEALIAMGPETQGMMVTVLSQLIMASKINKKGKFLDELDKIRDSENKRRAQGAIFLMVELAQCLKGRFFFVDGDMYQVGYVSYKDLLNPDPPDILCKNSGGEIRMSSLMEIFSGLKIGG